MQFIDTPNAYNTRPPFLILVVLFPPPPFYLFYLHKLPSPLSSSANMTEPSSTPPAPHSSDTPMTEDPPQTQPSTDTQLPPSDASNPATIPTAPTKPERETSLLSLPRELRDRIYTFALTSPSPFWWPTQHTSHHLSPALLAVSRAVYHEAAPLLYSSNKFLFTHPSDCNMFRVITSPFSAHMTSVCFRIREKDLRLWTGYLGSSSTVRSLRHDLPKLKSLWVFLRCGVWTNPALVFQNAHPHQGGMGGGGGGIGPGVGAGGGGPGGHMQGGGGQQGNNTNAPLPLPLAALPPLHPGAAAAAAGAQGGPPPAPPNLMLHAAGPADLLDRFFRWERDQGLENLCLSLQDKTGDAEVKVVCIQRLLRQDVRTLAHSYPDELVMDQQGDARTRFKRVWGVEVSLELSAMDLVPPA